MSSYTLTLIIILIIFPIIISAQGGSWQLLLNNVGISAMHMQLLNNDHVIMYDRTSFGPSNITLPSTKCQNPNITCTAHSVEYNVLNNTIHPLNVLTDTWCSSGAVLSDGQLVQTGGYNEGKRVVRTYWGNCSSSSNDCDWVETPNGLLEHRWYATNHILPNGNSIVIGGINAYNYEFIPKTSDTSNLVGFPFLSDVQDPKVGNNLNNLYPFVFLNVDGNLFVFANNKAILLNYVTNVVVRTYPSIPGGDPRNYPSTGSAVLLPLKNLELGDKVEAEVIICGGAPISSYSKAGQRQFLPALDSCARIQINDPNPSWVMETMPTPRVMGDMVMLPNGDVLIINGAKSGVAGWELGRDPILSPVIYHPENPIGSRFEVTNESTITRMYHSCAILLRDGRVLVGGSNPHKYDNFTTKLFPTELKLEVFLPPYLDPSLSTIRPNIISPGLNTMIKYGEILNIEIKIGEEYNTSSIKVSMVRPPFNTHSFSQSQRVLVLTTTTITEGSIKGNLELEVKTPGSGNIAPPGYYMLFVVHQNVPSQGIWAHIS